MNERKTVDLEINGRHELVNNWLEKLLRLDNDGTYSTRRATRLYETLKEITPFNLDLYRQISDACGYNSTQNMIKLSVITEEQKNIIADIISEADVPLYANEDY